jgi:hypothetical protein
VEPARFCLYSAFTLAKTAANLRIRENLPGTRFQELQEIVELTFPRHGIFLS